MKAHLGEWVRLKHHYGTGTEPLVGRITAISGDNRDVYTLAPPCGLIVTERQIASICEPPETSPGPMKNLFDTWLQGNENKDFEVMIIGDAGSGKSILARHLRKKYPYACVHEHRPQKHGIISDHPEIHACTYVFVIDRSDDGVHFLRPLKGHNGTIQNVGPFMLRSRDGEIAW